MIDEIVTSGKPPMSFEARLSTMSMRNLAGEANRISKKPDSKLGGGIADILLISFFKKNNRGNDPYMLEYKSQTKGGFEIK